MSCPYIFKKGQNKGGVCGAKLKDGSIYCHRHDRQESQKTKKIGTPSSDGIPFTGQTALSTFGSVQMPSTPVSSKSLLSLMPNVPQKSQIAPPNFGANESPRPAPTLKEVIEDRDLEIIKLPPPESEDDIKLNVPQLEDQVVDDDNLSIPFDLNSQIGFAPEMANLDKEEIEKERKIVEYYRTLDFLKTLLPIEERMNATADEWLEKIDEQRQKYFTEKLLIKRGMKTISQAIEYFTKNKLKMRTDGYSRIIENDKDLSEILKVISIKHIKNATAAINPEYQFLGGLALPLIALHFGSETGVPSEASSVSKIVIPPPEETIFSE